MFVNEMIAHSVSPIAGDNKSYYEYLDKLNLLAGKKEEQKPQEVFHTDQGAVYSSRAFQHAHKDDNITSFNPCRKGELQQVIQLLKH